MGTNFCQPCHVARIISKRMENPAVCVNYPFLSLSRSHCSLPIFTALPLRGVTNVLWSRELRCRAIVPLRFPFAVAIRCFTVRIVSFLLSHGFPNLYAKFYVEYKMPRAPFGL